MKAFRRLNSLQPFLPNPSISKIRVHLRHSAVLEALISSDYLHLIYTQLYFV
nr:MAG TPA: hypothetical protein [Caudoviricetes sp.]DAM45027.1 MAG TPA: hypothetical protein [Caudoviricetes sp.]DAN46764.1 MAG TPA: hypothetical protein [Caudoviricetes sp.]